MYLTPAQEQRVAAWWRDKRLSARCATCDRAAPVTLTLLTDLRYNSARTFLLRTCTYCGHIATFDAELMGLIEKSAALPCIGDPVLN